MEFKLDRAAWRRAAQRAREAAADAAGLALAAAQAVEQKAEEAAGRARLRSEVKALEEELGLQLQAVGELVYATHTGKPSDSEDMQELLEYIDGLYEQLEGHERALRELEGLVRICVCGEENPPESSFCRACGRPL